MSEPQDIASRAHRSAEKEATRLRDQERIRNGESPEVIQKENSAIKRSFVGAEISNLAQAAGK